MSYQCMFLRSLSLPYLHFFTHRRLRLLLSTFRVFLLYTSIFDALSQCISCIYANRFPTQVRTSHHITRRFSFLCHSFTCSTHSTLDVNDSPFVTLEVVRSTLTLPPLLSNDEFRSLVLLQAKVLRNRETSLFKLGRRWCSIVW